MNIISVDDVENETRIDVVQRKLSDPLGTTDIAINYYRLDSDEGLPGGLHTHMDQEEVFVVIEGEATFETYPPVSSENREGNTVAVGEGEAVRFAPGEFRSGGNDFDDDLAVLALGAPRASDDLRFPLHCPDCGHGELRFEVNDDAPLFVCPDCDSERVPQPCPDCGDDDLRVTLDNDFQPIVACEGCDARFDTALTTPLSELTE